MRALKITFTGLSLILAPLSVWAEESSPSWLFVQTATTVSIDENTLYVPYEREIFGFTDRPNRIHAYLNAHQLESLWDAAQNDNFSVNPPNAVVTWLSKDGFNESEVKLLSVNVGDFGRTVGYKFTYEAGDKLPEQASNVSIFIDSAHFDDPLRVLKFTSPAVYAYCAALSDNSFKDCMEN